MSTQSPEPETVDQEAASSMISVQRRNLIFVAVLLGMLLAALHVAGLATLTHTPSPMGFLQRILGRPDNERAYMLIAVGYPERGCQVPDLARKSLGDILTTY